LIIFGVLACCALSFSAEPRVIKLWHSYRGDEEAALNKLVLEWNKLHPEETVEPLSVPFDAYATKLSSSIPNDNGPDLFVAAHERLGDYVRNKLVVAAPSFDAPELDYKCLGALSSDGELYGLPLAYKSLALFYNKKLASEPPKTLNELIAKAKELTDPSRKTYGLAFEASSPYHAMPFLFGFGGRLFNDAGRPDIKSDGNAAGLAALAELVNKLKVAPEETNGALVSQLFNEGKAAFVINGPWFVGDLSPDVDFGVAPLPAVDSTGLPMRPLLTVEGVFFAAKAKNPSGAAKFAQFLVSDYAAGVRANFGRQNVANVAVKALDDRIPAKYREAYEAFAKQSGSALVTPSGKEMRLIWEPLAKALRKVLRGASEPKNALAEAQTKLNAMLAPPPNAANPAPYLVLLFAILSAGAFFAYKTMRAEGFRKRFDDGKRAYLYLLPTAVSVVFLIMIPFVVGSAISLFSHVDGGFTFVGLSNFWRILSCADYGFTEPLSFYFTLGVTVMWTLLNVLLHVTIGMILALMLRPQWLRLKGVYRALLIVPWAVPNYITALIWKGMFHKQMGAINALLSLFGMEPVSWFSQFSTSFAANLITNTWLGFPFMMVVTLGALQSVSKDLEEAAMVDGATYWQRLRYVVLPLLKPALLPAVVLGSVWTFNMFNIIYLVSGGEPDGATEILISEAYKWAFERNEQYGYAAAYAILIFIALYLFNSMNKKLLKQTG